MVIDTAHEIKVGVGYDWKPVVLGSEEMQISEDVMQLMGASIGDRVGIPLDFSGYFGENAKAKLFALMIAGLENVDIDLAANTLLYEDSILPLELLGIDPNLTKVEILYTLTDTYTKPNGKFSLIFAESAIVDCHYVFPSFLLAI